MKNVKYTTNTFIQKARKVHGNKYDYSKVNYKKGSEKINIICQVHGEFEQRPVLHLQGQGCGICGHLNKGRNISNTETFIQKAIAIHGNKYNYSKTNYTHSHDKVIIICSTHGEFEQKPNNHLCGYGCNKCGIINKNLTTEEFIEKARKVHGNKYDYSKVIYKSTKDKVIIICNKHDEFLQKPNNHLIQKQGCPSCKESTGEKRIAEIFNKYDIVYRKEFKFILEKERFEYDFYLPAHNVLIEFHGIQHYKSINYFGGDKRLKYTQDCDKKKRKIAKYYKIPLIEISYETLILSDEEFEKMLFDNIKLAITTN